MAPVRQAHLGYAGLVLALLSAALAGCGGGLSETEQVFVVDADGAHRRQLTHGDPHVTPAWSPDGRRIAFAAEPRGFVSLQVADRNGGHVKTMLRRRSEIGDVGIAWSPRGDLLAFLTRSEKWQTLSIDVVAPDGERPRRLLTAASAVDTEQGPVWAPDGRRVAFAGESGEENLYVSVVDLRGDRRRLTPAIVPDSDPRWSPRGDRILFVREVAPSVFVLRVVGAAGGRPQPLRGRWVDVWAEWSPDGREIALAGVPADRDGRYRLYVLEVENGALRPVAREPGAVRPAWSPDGRRIAFATQDGRIATLSPAGGKVDTLVDLGDAAIGELAWSPDGSRLAFTAAKPPPED